MDLLYSSGDSAQYYVAAWTGGEFQGEWIRVAESLCHPAETITTLLVGYSPISSKKLKHKPTGRELPSRAKGTPQHPVKSSQRLPSLHCCSAGRQLPPQQGAACLPRPQPDTPSGRHCFSPLILGVLKGPKRQLPLQIRKLPKEEASSSVVTHKITVYSLLGFPGGACGKESACRCRRHKTRRFNPWVRKIPREEEMAT